MYYKRNPNKPEKKISLCRLSAILGQVLLSGLVVIALSMQTAVAGRTVTNVTINEAQPLDAATDVQITVTVTTTGSNQSNDWESTSYTWDGGTTTYCVNSADTLTATVGAQETFPISTPLTYPGPFTLTVNAHNAEDCDSNPGGSTAFNLANVTSQQGAGSDNPDLAQSCGIPITIILDESGSIDDTEENFVRDAAYTLLNSLKNTGSTVSIVEFDAQSKVAEDVTGDSRPPAYDPDESGNYPQIVDVPINDANLAPDNPAGSIDGGGGMLEHFLFDGNRPDGGSLPSASEIANGTGSEGPTGQIGSDPSDDAYFYGNDAGVTNWEAALRDTVNINNNLAAQPASLVILLTDGDPTESESNDSIVDGSGCENTLLNSEGQLGSCMVDAISDAFDVKADGSHLLAVGVGSALANNTNSQNRLKAITGPDLVTDPADFDVRTTDVVIVDDFDDLGNNLSAVAFSLCAPSLSINKLVDDNGDDIFNDGVNDDPSNWAFSTFVHSVDGFINGTPPTTNPTTSAQFQWQQNGGMPGTIVGQGGYSLLSPSADPNNPLLTDSNGTATFEWKPYLVSDPQSWPTQLSFDEVQQPGYSFLPAVGGDVNNPPTSGSFCELQRRITAVNDPGGDIGDIVTTYLPLSQLPFDLNGDLVLVTNATIATCNVFNQRKLDYGDAPDSYGTNAGSNGPEHAIVNPTNLAIGPLGPDAEDGTAVASAMANTDDNLDVSDEDGVVEFQSYKPDGGMICVGSNGTYTTDMNEYCVVVKATNNSARPAQLVGWLDFGVDGSFSDAERSDTNPSNTHPDDDGTFTTGNVPANSGTKDYVLVFTGLGDLDQQLANRTYARFRITTEGYDPNGDGNTSDNTGFFSDNSPEPTGFAANGEVEDHLVAFGTLPVTLSHFSSARSGNYIDIDWGTSSELFNVGFQLWGLDGSDGQWQKLHNWLVKSGSGNAVEPQSYRKRVRIPRAIEQLVSVGISSVDSDGTEHYYGPFELGVSYGELGDLAPIAWDQVRAELDTRMAAQGYTKSGVNGYRKASSTSTLALSGSDSESVIEFRVSTPGVYRISGSELPQVWHSAPKNELALLDYQGNAVVRHVEAKGDGRGQSKALGTAGSIYFYSTGVNETERLYSDAKVYRLALDASRVLNTPIQRKQRVTSGFSEHYREVSVVEEDESYIFHSEGDDPWLDEVVIGYSDKLRVRRQPVPVEADLMVEDIATLLLNLGRSSALGAVDLDGDGVQDAEHIVTGTVTSADGVKVKLDPVSAVGSGRWELALPVPAGTVLGDANGVVHSGAFFNAGEGYAFSEVHIDSIGLEYSRPTVSKVGDDHLFFSGPDTGELGYSVRVPDLGDKPWVFASDGSNLVRIVLESQRRITDSDGVKWRGVTFSRLLGSELSPFPIHYWVSGRNGFYGVEGLMEKVVPGQDSVLTQAQGSDYVIVSHPMFMGPAPDGIDALSVYADFKRSQGYTVSVINYLDIVDSFGGGQVGPWGLTHYLSELKLQSPLLRYLLLVGSSVYDHSNKLGTGALTFIPGHYVPGSHSNFTVSDVPYITDGDGELFAHIGRWPVREISELQVIVNKSMQWGTQDHGQGEALLIAEHTVAGEEIDFAQALDGVAQVLPDTYTQHKVYVDAILAADPNLTLTQALAQAKGEIIDELNNAPEIVVYNGHASTGQLSNQNLFKHKDVSQVTTPGAEVWVPLSCYVTYYESTTVNTLAHQLLFTGNAVTITGAMLLSNQGENIQMGQSILEGTLHQGQSIGEAVNQAKTQQNNPNLTNNWAILGDPSSVIMTP